MNVGKRKEDYSIWEYYEEDSKYWAENLSEDEVEDIFKEAAERIWDEDFKNITSHPKLVHGKKDVTQVIAHPKNEDTKTRFAHTMELFWLCGKIAPHIDGVYEKVCYTVALAHDLGHLPYGHDTERYIREYLNDPGFSHAKMSVRILELFGVTLHPWVRYGIVHHSDGDKKLNHEIVYTPKEKWKKSCDLVAILDDVSCAVSDLTDVIREYGDEKDPKIQVFVDEVKGMIDKVIEKMKEKGVINPSLNLKKLKDTKDIHPDDMWDLHSALLRGFANDIIRETNQKNRIKGKDGIFMSDEMKDLFKEMKDLMYKKGHKNPNIKMVKKEGVEAVAKVMNKVEEVLCIKLGILKREDRFDYLKDYEYTNLYKNLGRFFATCKDRGIKIKKGEMSVEEIMKEIKIRVIDFICWCGESDIIKYVKEIDRIEKMKNKENSREKG